MKRGQGVRCVWKQDSCVPLAVPSANQMLSLGSSLVNGERGVDLTFVFCTCQVRLGEKELGSPEDSEELITVDAVGCFEDDEEEEEEEEGAAGEEEDLDVVLIETEDSAAKQVCHAEGEGTMYL